MLRISKGKETFALKGDHLETNFQGFYQKSLHWRPRSPMETSVHNPVCLYERLLTPNVNVNVEVKGSHQKNDKKFQLLAEIF